jgi:hypothetical protein
VTDLFLVYIALGVLLILARCACGFSPQPLWTILVGIPVASLIWPYFAFMWIRDLTSKK